MVVRVQQCSWQPVVEGATNGLLVCCVLCVVCVWRDVGVMQVLAFSAGHSSCRLDALPWQRILRFCWSVVLSAAMQYSVKYPCEVALGV